MMEEGPTRGITLNPFFCAMATTSAPGSAMAGQPASEMIPTGFSSSRGLRYSAIKLRSV